MNNCKIKLPSRDIEAVKQILYEFPNIDNKSIVDKINKIRRDDDKILLINVNKITQLIKTKKIEDFPKEDIDSIKKSLYKLGPTNKYEISNLVNMPPKYVNSILYSLFNIEKSNVFRSNSVDGKPPLWSIKNCISNISIQSTDNLISQSTDNLTNNLTNISLTNNLIDNLKNISPAQSSNKVIIHNDLSNNISYDLINNVELIYKYLIYNYAVNDEFGFSITPRPPRLNISKYDIATYICYICRPVFVPNIINIFISKNYKLKELSELIILSGGQSYFVSNYDDLLIVLKKI
jgi:hypothetical protein